MKWELVILGNKDLNQLRNLQPILIPPNECTIQWLNIGKNYTPYKSIQNKINYSNGHDYYFLKCYYFNI
jgi:hypothetical protein